MNTSPDNDFFRVLLNGIIPASFLAAMVQVLTRKLKHDITWTGAVLTGLLSLMLGVLIGSLVMLKFGDWYGLVASSISSLLGRELSYWFIYDFKIDKALNEVANYAIEKIKKVFR